MVVPLHISIHHYVVTDACLQNWTGTFGENAEAILMGSTVRRIAAITV
jgi:hypothetical protein